MRLREASSTPCWRTWTRAQLKQPATYAPDPVVSYHREGRTSSAADYAAVGRGRRSSMLRGSDGQNVTVVAQHFSATLHKKYDIEIAPGDLLKITKSDKQLGLLNGDRVRAVQAVSAEAVVVKTERGTIVYPGAASHEPAATATPHHDPFLSGPDFQPRADRGQHTLANHQPPRSLSRSCATLRTEAYTDRPPSCAAPWRCRRSRVALELRTHKVRKAYR